MVKIALTNQNKRSKYKKAIIDLATHTCLMNDEVIIDKNHFHNLAFEHPLLTVPGLPNCDEYYSHSYNDLEALLATPKFIYATLLQAADPILCRFRVSPSETFAHSKAPHQVPISMHHNKAATNTLTISELNHVISQSSGFTFQFQDQLLINDIILFEHLPKKVNGDELYSTHDALYSLMEQRDDFSQYELRYVHPLVGLGVYARVAIKHQAIVCIYHGMRQQTADSSKYCFSPKFDALELGVDARCYGSAARFVNHAHKPDKKKSNYLQANIEAVRYVLQGNEIIAYVASRDIQMGEQLLVDYGDDYFQNLIPYRFTSNGDIVDKHNKTLPRKKPARDFIRAMAAHGNKEAIWLLLKRPLIVLSLIILFMIVTGGIVENRP